MEIYQLFLENLPWPIWIESANTEIIFLNKKYQEEYNVNLKDVVGKKNKEVFSREIAENYDSQIKICLEKLTLCVFEKKIKNRYMACYMFPLLNRNKEVKGIGGVIVDISEGEEKLIELENKSNILRTIIDAFPEAIFYKDNECKFVGYNKNFEDFYRKRGITEIIGKTDLEIYNDKNTAMKFINQDKEIMETGETKYFEYSILDENGNKRREENLKVPIVNEKGKVWGIVGLSRDITERKELEENLKFLSYTDKLTGLYNRTSFEEKIKEINSEKNLPIGIIMGDVNGLKIVNDSIGHFQGDELLKNISKVLIESCHDKGHVFRWGGDEFIILLPNCNEIKCEEVISEIITKCENYKHDFIQLSIALGEVVKKELNQDIYECIKEVEERVYRQKLLQKKSVRSSIMESLKKSLEAKNMETEAHTERVVKYAMKIGKELKFKISELDELILVAKLHDIGKIAISEEILLKPGKLTKDEFEIMKTHAEKGYRIINASSELINVANCVLTHHERWDGKGYPLGLEGEKIPLMARIISIADSYDVMTTDRVYKKAMSKEDAIEELKRCSGTQFDPKIVNIFIGYLEKII
ncbi:sensor domain-containing diguanylate cyclase/phosphohydrolase [Clostridium carnis]